MIPPLLVGNIDASNITLVGAFVGGMVSCLSPCVMPIMPGYLSLITGFSTAELEDRNARRLPRIAIDTALFVAGFTVVFVMLGLLATSLGGAVFRNQERLTRISGAFVFLMALYLIASQFMRRAPGMFRDMHFHPRFSRLGPFAAPVAGAAFGLGWSPCLGPVLAAVLTVAANQQEMGRGVAMLVAYSLGLGVPFFVLGLSMGKLTGAFGWLRRHGSGITLVSAGVLGFFGIILMLNKLTWVTSELIQILDTLGLDGLIELG